MTFIATSVTAYIIFDPYVPYRFERRRKYWNYSYNISMDRYQPPRRVEWRGYRYFVGGVVYFDKDRYWIRRINESDLVTFSRLPEGLTSMRRAEEALRERFENRKLRAWWERRLVKLEALYGSGKPWPEYARRWLRKAYAQLPQGTIPQYFMAADMWRAE